LWRHWRRRWRHDRLLWRFTIKNNQKR
jgi:hypothetical protein